MRAFRCRVCDNPLHFENSLRVSCGTRLGFSRDELGFVAVLAELEPTIRAG